MNLAIDIGNSFTHFGVFKGEKLIKNFIIPTHFTIDRKHLFKDKLFSFTSNITNIGISSVVPSKNKLWNELAIKYFKLKPVFINNKIYLPIKLKIKNTNTLGSDRICNSVRGYEYFNRKENVIIMGFGTANTYDVVLKNGDFVGGIIAPGIETSAKALNVNSGKVPLLKYMDFRFNKSIVGNNTKEAIQSGLMNYALFATEGIVKAIEKEFRRKFKVIITGGNAKVIKSKLSIKTVSIENAVLEGINIILNYNK